MTIEPKHIFTSLLIIFKIYIILRFILRYKKMKKKISALENEINSLKNVKKQDDIIKSA